MADDEFMREKTAADSGNRAAQQAMDSTDGKGSPPDKPAFLGFTGSYPHSIDAKGRMIIPAAFREAWIDRRDMLANLVKRKPVAQKFLTQFTRYSYTDCESDAQGRLLLPQRIRAWRLEDARDVEVIGVFDHIAIIPAAKGQDQDRAFDEAYPDPLAALTELMGEE